MLVVVIDGGEGAEEEAADVGEDGGPARRDASFGKEIVESAEGVVDALKPLEIERITSEHLAKVLLSSGCRLVRAEPGGRIVREGAALASGRGAMLTTGGAGLFLVRYSFERLAKSFRSGELQRRWGEKVTIRRPGAKSTFVWAK
jgi:hypothetical protein